MQNETAHWSGERANLAQLTQDVQGRALGTSDSENQWVAYNEDRIGNGQITLDGLRAETAYWSGTHDHLNSVYQMVLGRSISQGDESNVYDLQQNIANGQTFDQQIESIARSEEAKALIDSFLNDQIGQVSDDLVPSSQIIMTNISYAYQTLAEKTETEIKSLASSFSTTLQSGNILNSLMPNSTIGWLELAANIALVVTPPGEAVVAGEVLAVGGEELLEESFSVVESKIISNEATGKISVQSGDGQNFAVDDVAHKIAYGHAAAKHIVDKHGPDYSLSADGINTNEDLEKYVKNTIEKIVGGSSDFEMGDLPGGGLKIWDKNNQTMTVLSPRANDFGTVYKPVGGKPYFDSYGK